jgi:hypothetical protein
MHSAAFYTQKNETEAADNLVWDLGLRRFPNPALDSFGVLRQVCVCVCVCVFVCVCATCWSLGMA